MNSAARSGGRSPGEERPALLRLDHVKALPLASGFGLVFFLAGRWAGGRVADHGCVFQAVAGERPGFWFLAPC